MGAILNLHLVEGESSTSKGGWDFSKEGKAGDADDTNSGTVPKGIFQAATALSGPSAEESNSSLG